MRDVTEQRAAADYLLRSPIFNRGGQQLVSKASLGVL
jgi:hypothetical protein